MAFPGKRDAWPKPEGALMFFDLDNYDATIFGQLSEYWQGVIKNSPEWQAQFMQSPDGYSPPPRDQFEDDLESIPF
jgi:hypothetical protein